MQEGAEGVGNGVGQGDELARTVGARTACACISDQRPTLFLYRRVCVWGGSRVVAVVGDQEVYERVSCARQPLWSKVVDTCGVRHRCDKQSL